MHACMPGPAEQLAGGGYASPRPCQLTTEALSLLLCRKFFQVWPSSTSFWNALHWAQLYNEPRPALRAFMYGAEYDISQVKAPTVLIGGSVDILAPPHSLDMAAQRMGAALVEHHKISGYSHMDFIWDAEGAKNIAYPQLLQALEKYAHNTS